MNEPSLPDKVVAIHEGLQVAGVAHAFGGALALAYYAEPRATIDIDLNVFVRATEHGSVDGALAPLGVVAADEGVVLRDGQGRSWWGGTPVDLFYAYDPFHHAMGAAVRAVPFGEAFIPVLAPEHLVVRKAVFDRPKDWLDIEQVLVCVEELDVSEIERWLDRIAGADDERRQRFTALAARA